MILAFIIMAIMRRTLTVCSALVQCWLFGANKCRYRRQFALLSVWTHPYTHLQIFVVIVREKLLLSISLFIAPTERSRFNSLGSRQCMRMCKSVAEHWMCSSVCSFILLNALYVFMCFSFAILEGDNLKFRPSDWGHFLQTKYIQCALHIYEMLMLGLKDY